MAKALSPPRVDTLRLEKISAFPPYTSEQVPRLSPKDVRDMLTAGLRRRNHLFEESGIFIGRIYQGIFDLSQFRKHPAARKAAGDLDELRKEVELVFNAEHPFVQLELTLPAIARLIDHVSSLMEPLIFDEGNPSDSWARYRGTGPQILRTGLSRMCNSWDVHFVADLNGLLKVSDDQIGHFMTVTSSNGNVFANTVACYVSWRWGQVGIDILVWLCRALSDAQSSLAGQCLGCQSCPVVSF